MTLIETVKKLLSRQLDLQYESMYYGKYRCRSCGAYCFVDYGDNEQETKYKYELCSANCPWRLLKEALENALKD